ncbi:hypothetical protein BDW75DRAFT_77016 [Aspergillus navahoensis]
MALCTKQFTCNSAYRPARGRGWVSFANGCSLGNCELHLLLALLVLRAFPRIRRYETIDADVMYDHDFFSLFPVWESRGEGGS